MRIARDVGSLRRRDVVEIVRVAIAKAHRDDFRVVEFSVQANHAHLLVEANGPASLTRGMQGLAVRLARRINARLGRRGTFFAERYHGRVLRTPREVRAAIRYVLLNARHHAAQRGQRLAQRWIDPCSSAAWFDGWREPIDVRAPWLRTPVAAERPTATPRTWLLGIGWRRWGPIAFDEVPGAHP